MMYICCRQIHPQADTGARARAQNSAGSTALMRTESPALYPSHLVVHLRLWLTEGDIDGFVALDADLMRGTLGDVFPMAANRCR